MGADALRFALAALDSAAAQHPALDRARRGLPPLRQQAVERGALRADEPRRLRRRALRRRSCATAATRAALELPERWILSRLQRACRARSTTALEAYRFADAAQRDLPLRLGRAVRLVHRAREAAPATTTPASRIRRSSATRTSCRACWRRRSRRRCACCTRSCRSSPRRSGSSCRSRRHAGIDHDHAVSGRRQRRSSTRRPRREMALIQDVVVAVRNLVAEYNVKPSRST